MSAAVVPARESTTRCMRTSQPLDVALTAYLNHRLAVQSRN